MPSIDIIATVVEEYLPISVVSILRAVVLRYRLTRLKFVLIDSIKPFRGPLMASSVGGSAMARTSNFFTSAANPPALPSIKITVEPFSTSFAASLISVTVFTFAHVIVFASFLTL